MPAQKGRAFALQVDMTGGGSYTTVAGLRTTEESEEFGEVDVTTKDSGGWFEQLAAASTHKLTVSAAGVFQNDTAFNKVRDYARAGSINSMKLIFDGSGTITGLFKVTALSRSGEHDGAVQYSLTLTSSGVPTFSAA